MNMVWIVARKEITSVLRNKGLLFAGFYVGGMFGMLNVLLGGHGFFENAIFSAALLAGVFLGYSFSRFVFLREKQERVVETLLCTPLNLRAMWRGKVLGVAVPAYSFSLLAVALVTAVTSVTLRTLVLPSAVLLVHIVGVVPVFTTAAISLMGYCQFILGMRENRIIGYVIVLLLVPFMYPSVFGLIMGDANVVISWLHVESCFVVAVLILALTTFASRYLSREKIVTTMTAD